MFISSIYQATLNEAFSPANSITFKALQIVEYVKELGKSFDFNTEMYKATFLDDINISSELKSKKVANSVGITESEVDSPFSTNKYKNILEKNKKYYQQNNITSVPTFIINDKYALVGAQSPDRFKDIFNKLINN